VDTVAAPRPSDATVEDAAPVPPPGEDATRDEDAGPQDADQRRAAPAEEVPEDDDPEDGPPGGRRTGWSAVWPTALVIAVYAVLAVAIYWHVWSTHPTTVTQVGGDQFDNIWFLRWAPFSVLHGHNPFYSNFANYPYGINLLTNTSALFLGALVSPVTLIWGPVAAFNTVSTVALAASATAGYFFVRRWVSWRPAAFAAGLLYGFGPYQIAQSAGHVNLTFVVFPPLIFLVVHEIVVRQHGKARTWGIVLGLLLVAQFFVSSEVLASTIVMGVICVVLAALFGYRRIRDHLHFALVGSAWAAGVAGVLLVYPVWFAVRGPGHISGPIQLVPQGYRADLAAPFVPDANQRFAPAHLAKVAANFANSTTENGSYLGVTLLLVLAVGTVVLWRRSRVIRVAALAGTAAFIISLGAGLVVKTNPPGTASGFPLPERLFTVLPLLKNTIPVRYSLYVALFAALALGVILDALHDRLASRRAARHADHRQAAHDRRLVAVVVPVAVAVVALLPLLPVAPFTASIGPLGTPAYFTSPALQRIPDGSVAVVYPYPSPATPNAQAWQAVGGLRFRMPGGYFLVPGSADNAIAFSPQLSYMRDTVTAEVLTKLATGSPPPLTPALRRSLLAEFRSWDVRSVVAFPAGTPDPAQAVAYLTALLGRSPVREPGGGFAWYGLQP